MKKHLRLWVCGIITILCGILGWWLVADLDRTVGTPKTSRRDDASPVRPVSAAPAAPRFTKRAIRDQFRDGTTVELISSAHPDQAILRFPSDESYGAFLHSLAASPVVLVAQLDRLRAMRLGYTNPADLNALLDGENLTISRAITRMPDRAAPGSGVQAGALGFGDQVMAWLGITGPAPAWGSGVKIAILDSGVVPHPALPALAGSIEIEPFPKDGEILNGHGTAVASLIVGAYGLAPAASITSIRVCDESGMADSFAIAAGFLAAMDSGAQLINISMGTYEDSPLIAEAVKLVQNQGIIIIAAAGNDGLDQAAYPAAYPGVISVGAVDGRSQHLEFSNYGDYLSLTAPGYLLDAAWPGGETVRVSGTSMSAPLVTGAIAAVMADGSGQKITATQAAEIVMNLANDTGIPGPDSQYGSGVLNLRRIINRNIPGLIDAAITDQRLANSADGGLEVRVTIQNRGTATLINTLVETTTPSGTASINATTIAPGAIETFSHPLRLDATEQPFQVTTRVILGTSGMDETPGDNLRSDTFARR